MTQREKLVELIQDAKKTTKGANCVLERDMLFADYLLENGVIVPPCKVGEKCYMVLEKLTGGYEVVETKLICFKQKDDLIIASCFINAPLINNSIEFYNDEIHTSIFITKEEAEKALAEKESD